MKLLRKQILVGLVALLDSVARRRRALAAKCTTLSHAPLLADSVPLASLGSPVAPLVILHAEMRNGCSWQVQRAVSRLGARHANGSLDIVLLRAFIRTRARVVCACAICARDMRSTRGAWRKEVHLTQQYRARKWQMAQVQVTTPHTARCQSARRQVAMQILR